MGIFEFSQTLYHLPMTWQTNTNGKKAFHGTTVNGGKFAIAGGVAVKDLLGFAEQLQKSLSQESPHGQPASSARLDPEMRVSV